MILNVSQTVTTFSFGFKQITGFARSTRLQTLENWNHDFLSQTGPYCTQKNVCPFSVFLLSCASESRATGRHLPVQGGPSNV
jgi:hypothetical protein